MKCEICGKETNHLSGKLVGTTKEEKAKCDECVAKCYGWKKTPIPKDYCFKGKIIEFDPEEHKKDALFCICTGGFGSLHRCCGTMIIGNFYPTLIQAIEDKGDPDKVGGNTRAFPIAQYVKEVSK